MRKTLHITASVNGQHLALFNRSCRACDDGGAD